MSTEALFSLTFPLAAPFWALMILAPGWRLTGRVTATPWVAVPPLAVWAVVALPHFGELWDIVTAPDLGRLAAFAGQPSGAAAIWAHIISFDLFIGRWIYLDSRRHRLHPAVMAPVLLLTVLLSPLGLPAYLALRVVTQRSAHRTAVHR